MKDFDEFHSWIEFEKNYYKSHRKHPVFDNEYTSGHFKLNIVL